MSTGSEFQTEGAATMKPREANVVWTRGTDNRLVLQCHTVFITKVAIERQNIAYCQRWSAIYVLTFEPPCTSLCVWFLCLSVCLSVCFSDSADADASQLVVRRIRRAKNINCRAPIWSHDHKNSSSPVLNKQGAFVAVKVATGRDTSIHTHI